LQPRGAEAGLSPSMQTLDARSAQPWAQTCSLGATPGRAGLQPASLGVQTREAGCADPRARGVQTREARYT